MNFFKTRFFKIAVIIIAGFMVMSVLTNIIIIFNKYGGFYFRESNGDFQMTKLPLFSYSAQNKVINRYNYVLSSTFNNRNVLFDLTYSIVNSFVAEKIIGSVTFGNKSYPIDDSFFIIKEKDKKINSLYIRSNNECFYIPIEKDKHISKSAVIRNIDCQSHYDASYSISHRYSNIDPVIREIKNYHNVENLKEYVTTLSESKFDIINEDEIEAASINTGKFITDSKYPESYYIGLKCSIPIIYDKKSDKYTIMLSDKNEYAESVSKMRKKVYKIMEDAFEGNTCPTGYDIEYHAVVDVFVTDYLISLLMEKLEFQDRYYNAVIVDRNTYGTLNNEVKFLFAENSLAVILFGAYADFYCHNVDIDINKIFNQVMELTDSSLNNFEENELSIFLYEYLNQKNNHFIVYNDYLYIYPNNNHKSIFERNICSIPLDKITDIVHSMSIYAGKL